MCRDTLAELFMSWLIWLGPNQTRPIKPSPFGRRHVVVRSDFSEVLVLGQGSVKYARFRN